MSRRGENIYHRKDGLWEARYVKEIDVYGKKKYGSVYAHSYREARAKKQDALDRILLCQKPVSVRSITVGTVVEEWLYINRSRIRSSTYQRYLGFWDNHIKNTVGDLQVVYFTSPTIREFAAGRVSAGLSYQSVNAILIFLHSCLKYGHSQYNLPMPEFKYFPSNQSEMRVFTQDEQRRLVAFLRDDIDLYKFGVLLTLYTGIRIGELCGLRWSDFSENCIEIRRSVQRLKKENGSGTELVVGPPKTRKSRRTIPLLSSLGEYAAHFREAYPEQIYVLGTPSKPIAESRVMQYKFQSYMRVLDIHGATFHTLRHTFATRSVEAGMDVKALSELLGHSNVQTTLNRYVHSSLSHKQANMEKLALFF